MAKKLTVAERKALETKRSPLAFARAYLHNPEDLTKPFEPRWNQLALLELHGNRLNTLRAQRGCGKSILVVALLLHYACTHKNQSLLVIGPAKLVVQRVFEKLIEQIDNSEFLSGSVTGRLKTPWQITFTTGCIIRGLSTGVASKQEARAIRGEHPQFIYIDEADLLNDEDWTGFSSLIDPTEPGSVPPIVYATTTPTGKRSHFWKLCESKGIGGEGVGWRDWWFAGRHVEKVTFEGTFTVDLNGWPVPDPNAIIKCDGVNPHWTKEADDRQRAMNGEQGWYHEIIAWWGDSTYAVWSKKLIYAAMERGKKQYTYTHGREHDGQLFTGGVDIDETQATPNFCVVEYKPGSNPDGVGGSYIVRLRESLERPSSGKIYIGLKNKVREIDRNFTPQAIYIDRGYGSLYVDEIIGMGIHSVQGKWFRQNVEVQNDKGEWEKKSLKHVMIAHATRLFEEGKISLSPLSQVSISYDVFGNPVESDEPTWDDEFIRQLENYMVVKITKTGVPEYTAKNEHAIDAFLLALFASVEAFDNPFSYKLETETAALPGSESAALGGQLQEVAVVNAAPRDKGDPTNFPCTPEEFQTRVMRRSGTILERPFSGWSRSSF